jgi:hypothetical protein
MPQDEDTADNIHTYVKSIDFIEDKTGYDFMSQLNDSIEDVIEAEQTDYFQWIGS